MNNINLPDINFVGTDDIHSISDQVYSFYFNGKKYHCHIDNILKYCQHKQVKEFKVNEIYKEKDKITPDYAMTTDTSTPIVMVQFNNGFFEVIDGNNRLYKAAHINQETIFVYTLTEDELNRFSS